MFKKRARNPTMRSGVEKVTFPQNGEIKYGKIGQRAGNIFHYRFKLNTTTMSHLMLI